VNLAAACNSAADDKKPSPREISFTLPLLPSLMIRFVPNCC